MLQHWCHIIIYQIDVLRIKKIFYKPKYMEIMFYKKRAVT